MSFEALSQTVDSTVSSVKGAASTVVGVATLDADTLKNPVRAVMNVTGASLGRGDAGHLCARPRGGIARAAAKGAAMRMAAGLIDAGESAMGGEAEMAAAQALGVAMTAAQAAADAVASAAAQGKQRMKYPDGSAIKGFKDL